MNRGLNLALELLDMQAEDVTTERQRKNGTMVVRFPIFKKELIEKNYNRDTVTLASYSSGYVRRLDNGTPYQLNPTKIVRDKRWPGYNGVKRLLMPDRFDRASLIINYVNKNWR